MSNAVELTADEQARVRSLHALPGPGSIDATTTFPNDEGYDELVLVRDIPFHSCVRKATGGRSQ